MFVSRGRHGPTTITGENAEALAIRARLIQKYGTAKARKHPDWPALAQAKPAKKHGNRHINKKAYYLEEIADGVAEGETIVAIAKELGISEGYARRLWRQIREQVE